MLQTFEIIWTLFYQNLAERQLLSTFLFILYTGLKSEDPDEMQHKVAFYQDLHCHLQGLKKHNFIYFTYPLQYIFRIKRVNLQHSIYRLLDRYSLHVISILFRKNVDPDQTASSETSYSGSTVLPKSMQYC